MIIINPGSGPVEEATEEQAREAMHAFVEDLQIVGLTFDRKQVADYGEGRFAFTVWYGDENTEVQMPGLAIDRVRYLGDPQNIWDYPRLYVGGSSWVWCFALGSARRGLLGQADDNN